MNLKLLAAIGLIFILLTQFLFLQGYDFLQNQQPLDYTHWLLLIGSVLSLSVSAILPKGIINLIATFLTILGVVATIGMCTIDFIAWGYGDNFEARDAFISHLRNTPSVYIPFLVVGPSLLYIGLATQAWQFIRSHTLLAVMTVGGSVLFGMGQFLFENRLWAVVGCTIFVAGLLLLIFKTKK